KLHGHHNRGLRLHNSHEQSNDQHSQPHAARLHSNPGWLWGNSRSGNYHRPTCASIHKKETSTTTTNTRTIRHAHPTAHNRTSRSINSPHPGLTILTRTRRSVSPIPS